MYTFARTIVTYLPHKLGDYQASTISSLSQVWQQIAIFDLLLCAHRLRPPGSIKLVTPSVTSSPS